MKDPWIDAARVLAVEEIIQRRAELHAIGIGKLPKPQTQPVLKREAGLWKVPKASKAFWIAPVVSLASYVALIVLYLLK